MRDEEIIGGVRLRILEDIEKAKIGPIMIKRNYQGQGYGQQVMIIIEERFPNYKTFVLDTIKQEKQLVSFYKKLGYSLTGEEIILNKTMTLVFFEKNIE